MARSWLRSRQCRILACNVRAPRGGEVDIVALDRGVLLFVEVKTRTGHPRIRPLDAVDRGKQALIQRGARWWLSQLQDRRLPWRHDVLEVLLREGEKPGVNHVRNAF